MATATARAATVSRLPLTALLWYSALLAVSFGPVLLALADQWQTDENVGHGPFVPLIVGFMVWERRAAWLRPAAERNRWGLVLVAAGAVELWLGTLGAEIFLQRTAFLLSLAGIVLFYGGRRAMRVLAFPLALLLFMIPIPGVLYKQITFPLQVLASRLAESSLELLGFSVIREGNVLELAGQQLSVVEACSGLRSLHSLAFFSLTYAYLFDPRPWMRMLLLGLAAPVAIVANGARIVATGILGEYDPQLATGVFHTVSGWTLFVVAIGLLAAMHQIGTRVLDRRRS